MQTVLKVKNLRKVYKGQLFKKNNQVLNDLTFSIPARTITGFLGINGSGKTTTIKCVLGLIQINTGEISFFDNQPLSVDVKKRLGFLSEKPNFYDHLTGEELVMFAAQMCTGKSKKELVSSVEFALKAVDMYEPRKRLMREYSKGMYQRIGIAQSIVHKPEFVVLDEPMSDLDPRGRNIIKEALHNLKDMGTAIFFSSHLLADIEELCSHLVILKDGVCAYEGAVDNFLNKIDSGFEVTYGKENQKGVINVSSLDEAQITIDRLRSEKKVILNFQSRRPSLEKAFVDFVGSK